MVLLVDGSGTAIASKMAIDVYFRRCKGRLALDWMYLRKFSSNFRKN